jgi:hypothetical protein
MAEISNKQIYDLMLEISRDVTGLEASVDELLFDVKAFNQELRRDQQLLMQQVCSE